MQLHWNHFYVSGHKSWIFYIDVYYVHAYASTLEFCNKTWIQIHVWGFRYKLHSQFFFLISMQREVICGFLKSKRHVFKTFLSLTDDFISKECDFAIQALCRRCFVHLFHHFNLVMITKQTFHYDRHSYFPLFANSYMSQTTWVM